MQTPVREDRITSNGLVLIIINSPGFCQESYELPSVYDAFEHFASSLLGLYYPKVPIKCNTLCQCQGLPFHFIGFRVPELARHPVAVTESTLS